MGCGMVPWLQDGGGCGDGILLQGIYWDHSLTHDPWQFHVLELNVMAT